MASVERIYPEPKTALINWIEQNFHDIESYVFVARLDDGTIQTIHDISSKIEALGMLEVAKRGEFQCRPK